MARTEREERMLNRLQAGARNLSCGVHLEALSPLQRNELYTTLLFDRLQRKMRTVTELWEEATRNWNQTFYLMYFRTLGDRTNQAVYLELARRVPYRIVLRERLAPHAVEAMLLGCSGLLDLYRDDSYTLDLRRSFEYLAAKYSLERLDAQAWELAGIRPANHPVLRLAQAAEFFTQDEFIMQRAMECCNENDVRRLFRVEASEYWRTHYILHPRRRQPRYAQAAGQLQGQHHRHQSGRRAAIRLRQLHGTRGAARPLAHAARTARGGGQPLHPRLAQQLRAGTRQRLRDAGAAAAGHRILRRTPLHRVSAGPPAAATRCRNTLIHTPA